MDIKPTQVELAVDLAAAWNITIADVTQQLRDAKVKREAAMGMATPTNFADEKSQAECLCLPATITVMLLEQEVDFFGVASVLGVARRFASEAKVESMASLLSADAIGFDLAGRLKTDSLHFLRRIF